LLDFFEQARKYVKKRLPERRKGGRLALSAATKLLVHGEASNVLVDATICNLSSTGIAFLMAKPLANGAEFSVRLPTANGKNLWVRCKVTRWQASPSGARQVGAQFCDIAFTDAGELPVFIDPSISSPTADKAMTELLKRLASVDANSPAPIPAESAASQAAKSEKRKARRVPIKFYSTATLFEGTKSPRAIRILLQDISTSGIGFQCPTDCPKGAQVAFMLQFSPKKMKAILSHIVRSKKIGAGQFLVGAEMLEAVEQRPTAKSLPKEWMASRSLGLIA